MILDKINRESKKLWKESLHIRDHGRKLKKQASRKLEPGISKSP